ncbi:MAG: serine/threonine protein kinase [Proteobacteria bacterium]|nr:serine/threonine protein kinase [Pseudomonadota bacterium]
MDEQWGKYRIKRFIARGGMAEVFQADMGGPSGFIKPVCLKRVRAEFSGDPDFVQSLEGEARIAASLQHTNIVQVFDFDRHEGQLFLAMEFVDGADLRHVLNEVSRLGLRLPLEFAIHVMKGLLSGLSHAHGQCVDGEPRPVIHRDVSPHNILISTKGEVKLTDFGIAKAKGLSDATRTGVFKGKLAYLSPEQASGEKVQPRSDLFSAGLIFWEMLSGSRFFQGKDEKEMVAQVLSFSLSPIPGISTELNQLVARLLAKNPEDRFESADAALKALSEIDVAGCDDPVAGQLVSELIGRQSSPIQVPNVPPTRVSTPADKPPIQGQKLPWVWIGITAVVALAFIAWMFSLRGQDDSLSTVERIIETSPLPGPTETPPIASKAEMPIKAPEPKTDEIDQPPPVAHLIDEPEADAGPQVKGPDVSFPKTRAAPKKNRTRPSVKYGHLKVYVRPWARVEVDGTDQGTTPIKNLRVRTGPHQVTLINDRLGFRKDISIRVRPEKTTVINRNIASPAANSE